MLRAIGLGVLAGTLALTAAAQDTQYAPKGVQIPTPDCSNMYNAWDTVHHGACLPFTHEHWLKDLEHWRSERRIRTGYDPARYELPALRWTQSSFIQPQMMVQDRYFYDPATGQYTVDRYVDDLEKRYGGIDSVLVWSTYPNMGIDDRNQLDMAASMPGGL
jgi:gamma-glutamyl hercynylcysteine S-oxide synthase